MATELWSVARYRSMRTGAIVENVSSPAPQIRAAETDRESPRPSVVRQRGISWSPARAAIAGMHPAYFALVMATGILGVGCDLLDLPTLPTLLLWLNLAAYPILIVLSGLRMVLFPARFLADFSSHQRGPGFFTAVAATSVIGIQMFLQLGNVAAARGLWWLALALWLVLTYGIFTALTVREKKPSLADGINGGWLTAVVATQSLVALGVLVIPSLAGNSELAALVLVSLWLAGGMLYIWMISLIFYRYTFLRFLPSDLMPPYWINMGAMAISTLAGSLLILHAERSALLTSILPFLKGFTLLFWATATWWIPMLLVLGVWRYVYRRVPLTYDPLYWGAVFPLAMYSVATFRLAQAFDAPYLAIIPKIFISAALTTWLMTMLGLLMTLTGGVLRTVRAGSDGKTSGQRVSISK